MALLHALKRIGKEVRIINIDQPPRKYDFLGTEKNIEVFNGSHDLDSRYDLALILDTNDARLVEPLFSALQCSCQQVLFVDHHPPLQQGPQATAGSLIDTSAASTGQLVYQILKALEIPLDQNIARALYVSLVFDTQLFRYVKSDPASHMMAAELLMHEVNPEEVHRRLFGTYTVEKVAFLGRALSQVEYLNQNRSAFVSLNASDFRENGLDLDESGDVIDMIMNVESIEVAALLRQDAPDQHKLSLRSKGSIRVLELAEKLGGGGHPSSAGAYVKGTLADLRETLITEMKRLVDSPERKPLRKPERN